ncbi:MAG TPA: hypothetical protein VF323_02765 [Candidatus Limnocylindrales bacterium]
MPLEILVVVLIVAVVVVAFPVRRLRLDGYSGWAIVAYLTILGLIAVGVTEARTLARYLLPLLGLVYIVPFITLGSGFDRLLGRRRPVVRVTPVATRAIEPPRDVTPRDVTPKDASAPADAPQLDPVAHDEPAGRAGSDDLPGPSA